MKLLHSFPIYLLCLVQPLTPLTPLFTHDCLAADFKVATVDVNQVINELAEAKEKKKALDDMSLKAKQKLQEKSKELKAMEKSIQEGKIAENSQDGETFRREAKNFSRLVKDTEEELKKEFLKTNRALTGKVFKVIEEYSKKHELALVLDKSESQRGVVLFGDPSSDITREIIGEMNR